MGALKNAKHEAFARAIVVGKTGGDAYAAAGYKASAASARTNAARLLAYAGVAQRIAELKAKAADAAVMDLREVLAELSKIGRASIKNYVARAETTGDVVEALQSLADEHAAAIQELTIDTYMDGAGDEAREVKRVRLKLYNKTPALGELRSHYEPSRHEHTGKDGGPIESKDVTPVDELELARRIAFALERAARTKEEG